MKYRTPRRLIPDGGVLPLQETWESLAARRVARENPVQLVSAHVAVKYFGENVAEIGGQRQVASFVEVVVSQAGPFTVDLAALDSAADGEGPGPGSTYRAWPP